MALRAILSPAMSKWPREFEVAAVFYRGQARLQMCLVDTASFTSREYQQLFAVADYPHPGDRFLWVRKDDLERIVNSAQCS